MFRKLKYIVRVLETNETPLRPKKTRVYERKRKKLGGVEPKCYQHQARELYN